MVDEHHQRVLTSIVLLGEPDDERVLVAEDMGGEPCPHRRRQPDAGDPGRFIGKVPAQVVDGGSCLSVVRRRQHGRQPGGDQQRVPITTLPAAFEHRLLEGWSVRAVEWRPDAGAVEGVEHPARPHLRGNGIVGLRELPCGCVDQVVDGGVVVGFPDRAEMPRPGPLRRRAPTPVLALGRGTSSADRRRER